VPLAGFGQYYLRAGRCHLGRRAVATYSLFVLPGNERALHLYQRLGFEPACYPEPDPVFDDCIYMVAASLRT
jgi:ribosomal protein S18 acetylase RimI-like enzyme